MPYIKKADREKFDETITQLANLMIYKSEGWRSGDLNYVVSKLIWKLFDNDKRYQTANDIWGALNGVIMEFYRRKVAPYEDEKIKENGDL